jgi:outer membrane lipoprotein-sorting protein
MKPFLIPMKQCGKQCYRIILLLSILASAAAAVPDSLDVRPLPDPTAFIRESGKLSKNTSSIESDFVQKKHLSVFSEDIVSKGKFFYKRENRLRWAYANPIKYALVFNGGKITVQDGDKTTMFDAHSNPMFAEISNIMVSCLNGTILTDSKRFKASFFETRSTYIVSLLPASESLKGVMQRIELVFRKRDLLITQLHIIELSGDYSNISFHNTKLNVTIPDATFTIQ